MATETKTAEEAAAEAYEESVRNSASLSVTELLAMRAMFRSSSARCARSGGAARASSG